MKTFNVHIKNSATFSDIHSEIQARDIESAMVRTVKLLSAAKAKFGGVWTLDNLSEKVKA